MGPCVCCTRDEDWLGVVADFMSACLLLRPSMHKVQLVGGEGVNSFQLREITRSHVGSGVEGGGSNTLAIFSVTLRLRYPHLGMLIINAYKKRSPRHLYLTFPPFGTWVLSA